MNGVHQSPERIVVEMPAAQTCAWPVVVAAVKSVPVAMDVTTATTASAMLAGAMRAYRSSARPKPSARSRGGGGGEDGESGAGLVLAVSAVLLPVSVA